MFPAVKKKKPPAEVYINLKGRGWERLYRENGPWIIFLKKQKLVKETRSDLKERSSPTPHKQSILASSSQMHSEVTFWRDCESRLGHLGVALEEWQWFQLFQGLTHITTHTSCPQLSLTVLQTRFLRPPPDIC